VVTERRRQYIADYNLKRYHARMAEAIEILGGVCTICGSSENLQLDHIDPDTKSYSLGKLWSVSLDSFLNELTKCQVLCDDCHKAKTLTFDQKAIQAKKGNSVRGPRQARRPRKRSGILTQE